jgi:hypothetical protein
MTREWLVPPVNPSIPYLRLVRRRNYLLEHRRALFRDPSSAQRAPILETQLDHLEVKELR